MHISEIYLKRLFAISFTLLLSFSIITLIHTGSLSMPYEGDIHPQETHNIHPLKLPPVSLKISAYVTNGTISFYIALNDTNTIIFSIENFTNGVWYFELPYRTVYSFNIKGITGNASYSIMITLYGLEKDFVELDISLLLVTIFIFTIIIIQKFRNKNSSV